MVNRMVSEMGEAVHERQRCRLTPPQFMWVGEGEWLDDGGACVLPTSLAPFDIHRAHDPSGLGLPIGGPPLVAQGMPDDPGLAS
ncbi:MAG: hypothetical protein RL153_856 [Verrucomicrobiota bacterium]